MPPIPTYIVNLKKRLDRREHIIRQFSGKTEFDVHLIEAIEHTNGSLGLWSSFTNIIQNFSSDETEYILVCEDDHQFTVDYNSKFLFGCISEAQKMNADILSGGISWFEDCFIASKNLVYIRKFTGLQFTIIFKKFFPALRTLDLDPNNTADLKISELSPNKFVVYPFISVQKDFGYSDATPTNNSTGQIELFFARSFQKLGLLKTAHKAYQNLRTDFSLQANPPDYDDFTIPVYVINLPERQDRLRHIKCQFHGRKEFDVNFVEAEKHLNGALGLWLSIRKIIERSVNKNEDVIIICEDDHEFTSNYSKEYLLKNVIEAHHQGAEIILGGIAGFTNSFPVSKNRFWISAFWATQFIVVYKNMFHKILDAAFDETTTADGLLSSLADHKMALYPFISIQREFGYSDVTRGNSKQGYVNGLFIESASRFKQIHNKYLEICYTPFDLGPFARK